MTAHHTPVPFSPADIAALVDERDAALAEAETLRGSVRLAQARAVAAEKESDWRIDNETRESRRADHLLKALRKYGRHDDGCPMHDADGLCTCGLAVAALADGGAP